MVVGLTVRRGPVCMCACMYVCMLELHAHPMGGVGEKGEKRCVYSVELRWMLANRCADREFPDQFDEMTLISLIII